MFLTENIEPVKTHRIIHDDEPTPCIQNDEPPSLITKEDIDDEFSPTPTHNLEFSVGDELIYCRDGHVEKVTLILFLLNNKTNIFTYNVKLPNDTILYDKK